MNAVGVRPDHRQYSLAAKNLQRRYEKRSLLDIGELPPVRSWQCGVVIAIVDLHGHCFRVGYA